MTARWFQNRDSRPRSRLWSRSREGDADLSLLCRAFEHWCRRARPSTAALYLEEEDGGLGRVVSHLGDQLPERLVTPAHDGCTALELPGGWLLSAGAGEVPEEAAEALLLVSATRALQLAGRLRRQSFQARYRGVELEALYDVGLAVVSTLDLSRLSEEILFRAVSLLDARRGALYELDGVSYRLRSGLGGDAAGEIDATEENLRSLLERRHQTPGALLPGCLHALAVKVEGTGAPPGLLLVGDKESRVGVGPFSELDQRTLGLFTRQAGIALENAHLHRQALEKERLEREMQLASDIQRQILPKTLPELSGWDLAGWSCPARQVGGDYFDVRALPGERLLLVVADVSGKGMPAALLVSNLHSALRLLADSRASDPALLVQLNRHVLESSLPNKFITLLLVEVDRSSGRATYLNAGHNPALVLRADGGLDRLEASGPPVGLLPDATYAVGHVTLGPGDLLCLYSDGITECADEVGEEWGESGLLELLGEHPGESLPGLVERVECACRCHAGSQPQGDDQTLVLVRRH